MPGACSEVSAASAGDAFLACGAVSGENFDGASGLEDPLAGAVACGVPAPGHRSAYEFCHDEVFVLRHVFGPHAEAAGPVARGCCVPGVRNRRARRRASCVSRSIRRTRCARHGALSFQFALFLAWSVIPGVRPVGCGTGAVDVGAVADAQVLWGAIAFRLGVDWRHDGGAAGDRRVSAGKLRSVRKGFVIGTVRGPLTGDV